MTKAGVCLAAAAVVVVDDEKIPTFVAADDGTLNADTDPGIMEAISSVVVVIVVVTAAAIKSDKLLVIPTMVSFVT